MNPTQTAYFAGGCFWCITPTFRQLEGVARVISGYSGGHLADPTYQQVKTQTTGHRETIRIDFDPDLVSFDQLLEIFLCGVDPFDAGGQFIDRGHSYTLAVYYCHEAQRQSAQAALDRLEKLAGKAPCISLEPFVAFYAAEDYHQDYDLKNPEAFQQELRESGRL